MEYASKGVANTALGLGIAGLATNFLNGGLGNILGTGNNCAGQCAENMTINRYELNMVQENTSLKTENALLRADKYTDDKIIETYKDLVSQINAVKETVNANTCAQAVTNQKLADNITFVDSKFDGVYGQIAQTKQDLLCYVNGTFVPGKLVMPLDSICPAAQPATTTTTTTPTTTG